MWHTQYYYYGTTITTVVKYYIRGSATVHTTIPFKTLTE